MRAMWSLGREACGRFAGLRLVKAKEADRALIYFHAVAQSQIRMLLIYRKGIKDDLTPKEKSVLRKINAEW